MIMAGKIKVGVHPINWCNDDMPDLGDHYTFENIVDEAAQAGYAGIELGRKFPRAPGVLRGELARRGLQLTSGWCDTMFACPELRDEYMRAFEEKAHFLKESGAGLIVAAEGTNSSCWDPREYRGRKGVAKLNDAEWKSFCAGLDEAGAYCNDLGLRLVYHVHTGTAVETHAETRRLCENTAPENVSILADTGHLHLCDVDIPRFFEEFADRIGYVHLKNVRKIVHDVYRDYRLDFNSAVKCGIFTVPGDGGIDFKPIFKLLKKNDYDGWVIVEAEQYLPSPPALYFAQLARNYLAETLGA